MTDQTTVDAPVQTPTAVAKNAKINSTFLGFEDHGIFTFAIGLEYGGAAQSAGLYALDRPVIEGQSFPRVGKPAGLTMMQEVLRVLQVKKWEDLPGTPCRVMAGNDKVFAIGHLLEDRWVEFEEVNARFDHTVTGLTEEYIANVTGTDIPSPAGAETDTESPDSESGGTAEEAGDTGGSDSE